MRLTNPTSNPSGEEQKLMPQTKPEQPAGDWLIQTLAEYKFVLPGNAIEWRAKRVKGSLPSLSLHSALMIATDGIVAYFVLGDGTVFYGHLAAFEEDKERKETKAKPEKKLTERQKLLQSI